MTSTRNQVTAFLLGVVITLFSLIEAMTSPPDWLVSWLLTFTPLLFLAFGTTEADDTEPARDSFKFIAAALTTLWWVLFPLCNFGLIPLPASTLIQVSAGVIGILCITLGHAMLGMWIGKILNRM